MDKLIYFIALGDPRVTIDYLESVQAELCHTIDKENLCRYVDCSKYDKHHRLVDILFETTMLLQSIYPCEKSLPVLSSEFETENLLLKSSHGFIKRLVDSITYMDNKSEHSDHDLLDILALAMVYIRKLVVELYYYIDQKTFPTVLYGCCVMACKMLYDVPISDFCFFRAMWDSSNHPSNWTGGEMMHFIRILELTMCDRLELFTFNNSSARAGVAGFDTMCSSGGLTEIPTYPVRHPSIRKTAFAFCPTTAIIVRNMKWMMLKILADPPTTKMEQQQ